MVTEVPDDPNPKAVAMARWLLFALGVVCFVIAGAIFFPHPREPSTAILVLSAAGAVFLLSSAFGRPHWLIALVLLMVEP
jgi:hypothetical protein